MIICRSFAHPLQKKSGGLFGAARFVLLPFFAFDAYGRARPSA
jgi:hypothetical protein